MDIENSTCQNFSPRKCGELLCEAMGVRTPCLTRKVSLVEVSTVVFREGMQARSHSWTAENSQYKAQNTSQLSLPYLDFPQNKRGIDAYRVSF